MKKDISITFIDNELEKEFLNLRDDDFLKKRIKYVIERIKENPTFGRPIAKRLIPKEYLSQGVDNAFWVELNKGRGWRLIYSLTPDGETQIIAIILEWFTRHKDYERRFKY
ncbi:hypothetical protein GOV12_03925 [Candidatus Pacearchaeota archaeon]|nr:hypothetical protein [Candidatus Pacearchaeota archaeon]